VRVVWLQKSLSDLDEVFTYIAADDPGSAAVIVERIKRAAANLADFPCLGRQERYPGIRQLVLGRTPFIVLYRVCRDSVSNLGIYHGWQLAPFPWRRRGDESTKSYPGRPIASR
jgi:toxin ParE1/3/4